MARIRGASVGRVVAVCALVATGAIPAIGQTGNSDDFILRVAYCLGTRQAIFTQYQSAAARDCAASADARSTSLCDAEQKTLVAVGAESNRLRLYLLSMPPEKAFDLGVMIAIRRGGDDLAAIENLPSCPDGRPGVMCADIIGKERPDLGAAMTRVKGCVAVLQALPF